MISLFGRGERFLHLSAQCGEEFTSTNFDAPYRTFRNSRGGMEQLAGAGGRGVGGYGRGSTTFGSGSSQYRGYSGAGGRGATQGFGCSSSLEWSSESRMSNWMSPSGSLGGTGNYSGEFWGSTRDRGRNGDGGSYSAGFGAARSSSFGASAASVGIRNIGRDAPAPAFGRLF